MELRVGGETGVTAVRCLAGHEAVWPWLDSAAGSWVVPLVEAAMRTLEPNTDGVIARSEVDYPHLFLIQFADGLRGAVLMLGDGYINKMAYADNRCDPDAMTTRSDITCTAVQYHVTNSDNSSTAAFGCASVRHDTVSCASYPTFWVMLQQFCATVCPPPPPATILTFKSVVSLRCLLQVSDEKYRRVPIDWRDTKPTGADIPHDRADRSGVAVSCHGRGMATDAVAGQHQLHADTRARATCQGRAAERSE